jgi:hypothetical protein
MTEKDDDPVVVDPELAQLVSGITHDLRNVLMRIGLAVDVALDDVGDRPIAKQLKVAKKAVQEGTTIVLRLRRIAGKDD